MSIHDDIRDHLLRSIIYTPVGDKTETFDEIMQTKACPEADRREAARMGIGHFRYGRPTDRSVVYDNVGSAIKRLKKYQQGGNGEHLDDARNLIRIEQIQKNHPSYHYDAADDGEHAEVVK